MEEWWIGYTAAINGKLPMANPYGYFGLPSLLWRQGWKSGRKLRVLVV